LAITKKKKQELVAQYTDLLSRSQATILTDYRGLTATEISGLRNKLREVDSQYHVIKNTLFRLALQNVGHSVPEELPAYRPERYYWLRCWPGCSRL